MKAISLKLPERLLSKPADRRDRRHALAETRFAQTARSIVSWTIIVCLVLSAPAGAVDQQTGGAGPAAIPSPLTPDQERLSFELADPNLSIELVACEPAVRSPVAIAWDAEGRLYVAQMIGYPETQRRDRITRLEDRDRDGFYEHSIVFADEMSFPTSVMPYRGGVLVTAAPDILFLEDSDGDGRADLRRVEWTGFGTGSQQLRANGLAWGLDNWIYGANGRCDGEVVRPGAAAESAVSIRSRDFRFRPGQGRFEAIAGQSQFGQCQDDWGNRYLSWNTIPVRQVVIPPRYVARQPRLAAEAVIDLASPDDSGEVFPISPPPRQFNRERANYYNALCGLTIYRGDAMGPDYSGDAFVGEALSNLVTRRRLRPHGPAFSSQRAETGREFLASADPWFHPVSLTTGPDGALYVVDFYRELVEHPLYVASQETRSQVDWRRGFEHGRIWRIRRRDHEPGPFRTPDLANAPTATLVENLSHPVGWWRDTSQRLLIERHDTAAIGPLEKVVSEGPSPLGRLHALWTLDGLGALSDQLSLRVLGDAEPRLRVHALRLIDQRLPHAVRLEQAVVSMTEGPDKRVRFQLGLTAGFLDPRLRFEVLIKLITGSPPDPWVTTAVLSSAMGMTGDLVRQLAQNDVRLIQTPDELQLGFLNRAGKAFGEASNADSLELALALLDDMSGIDSDHIPPGQVAFLAGVLEASRISGQPVRELAVRSVADDQLTARLDSLTKSAVKLALNSDEQTELREAAIEVLVLGATGTVAPALKGILFEPSSQAAGLRAARVLADLNDEAVCSSLYDDWASHRQPARSAILAAANRSPASRVALLDAISKQTVRPAEVPLPLQVQLKQSGDVEIKKRIAAVFPAPQPVAGRAEVVRQFQDVVNIAGDPRRGAALVKQHCLACHTIQRVGVALGPDLSGIGGRPPDEILVSILDPSRQVPPDYLQYTAVTKGGQVYAGLILAETDEAMTLGLPQGEKVTVPASELEMLQSSLRSLMPDGVEQQIDRQGLADLLAFLRQPDRRLLQAGM